MATDRINTGSVAVLYFHKCQTQDFITPSLACQLKYLQHLYKLSVYNTVFYIHDSVRSRRYGFIMSDHYNSAPAIAYFVKYIHYVFPGGFVKRAGRLVRKQNIAGV